MIQRQRIIARIQSGPTMPPATGEAIALFQSPNTEISELLSAIEYDPGLTSNLLRLSNSAYFGCRREISSVREAIVRLGTGTVLGLLIGSWSSTATQEAIEGYDLPAGALWERSVAVGVGVDLLAEEIGLGKWPYAFTAGLLHDIGKLVLGAFVEVDAVAIVELAYEQEIPFDQAEREILGIDHAEVGAMLLQKWGLPERLSDACRWHHRPDEYRGEAPVVDLIHVADFMCSGAGIGSGHDGLNYRSSASAMERLGVKTNTLEIVMCQMLEKTREVSALLKN